MSILLSRDELIEITERVHCDAQKAVLDAIGVPAKIVGRRLIVSRSAFEAALAGRPQVTTARPVRAVRPLE
jgi:hypothetical protein